MSIQGRRELEKRLRAIGQMEAFLREVQLDTIAGGKARVHRRTGFLGRSIVPGNVDDNHAIVYVNAPYAAAEEFGRKQVTIVPKRARVLAWPKAEGSRRLSGRARTGTKSGDMGFAMKVVQKARKGHPYIIPAAIEALRKRGVNAIVERWNRAA